MVDDAGHEVPTGEPGEVVVRGYNVMKGYFDEPEETAATIDADGWLHTGDIGVMDERGYLRITDRKKDMFIVGGFNAYPAEIENILLGNAKVAQAAVVGVPDERMGEVGVAFVIPRPGEELTPAEVIDWSRAAMANYKVPRHVELVDALPLNASGKVLKYELRQQAARLGLGPDRDRDKNDRLDRRGTTLQCLRRVSAMQPRQERLRPADAGERAAIRVGDATQPRP